MTFAEIKAAGDAKIAQYDEQIRAAANAGDDERVDQLTTERDQFAAALFAQLIATPEYQESVKHIQQAATYLS